MIAGPGGAETSVYRMVLGQQAWDFTYYRQHIPSTAPRIPQKSQNILKSDCPPLLKTTLQKQAVNRFSSRIFAKYILSICVQSGINIERSYKFYYIYQT